MKEIPKHLIDNPNYYIDGGKLFSEITLQSKEKIHSILNGYDIEECLIPPGYSGFKLKKEGNDIGYVSYYIEDSYLKIRYVKINDGNNKYKVFNNQNNYQGQGYGKKLYLGIAIEAKKKGLVFTSDHHTYIKNKAKFIWNSLANDGLAQYMNNRFIFINDKLP